MVEANRTVVIPLIIPEESKSDFHQTILPYAYCQQEAVEYCWPDAPKQPSDLTTSKRDVERAIYDRLRAATNEQLHSNLVFVRAGHESTGLGVGDTLTNRRFYRA